MWSHTHTHTHSPLHLRQIPYNDTPLPTPSSTENTQHSVITDVGKEPETGRTCVSAQLNPFTGTRDTNTAL